MIGWVGINDDGVDGWIPGVERAMRRGDRMMRRNALDKDQKKT